MYNRTYHKRQFITWIPSMICPNVWMAPVTGPVGWASWHLLWLFCWPQFEPSAWALRIGSCCVLVQTCVYLWSGGSHRCCSCAVLLGPACNFVANLSRCLFFSAWVVLPSLMCLRSLFCVLWMWLKHHILLEVFLTHFPFAVGYWLPFSVLMFCQYVPEYVWLHECVYFVLPVLACLYYLLRIHCEHSPFSFVFSQP